MKKVVIVGAGILGASIAYELSKHNIHVTIVDADITGAATNAGAGIICPWTTKRRNKLWYKLSKNGARYYPKLIESLEKDNELDHGYARRGALSFDEDYQVLYSLKHKLLKMRDTHPEIGDLKLLNKQETTYLYPFSAHKFHSLFIEGAAQVDGRKLKKSLLSAAIKNNVKLINGYASLHQSLTEKPILEINNNPISYDYLIAANGAWMKDFFEPIDIQLRTDFQKGQIIHLKNNHLNTEELPILMMPNSQYILGFPNNKLVVGPTREPVSAMDTSITANGIFNILKKLNDSLPLLLDAEVTQIKMGFRPNTFNRLPVFGALPNYPYLYLANGLGASGLTTGPYIAKLLSQLVLNKKTAIDTEPYRVSQLIKNI